MPRKIVVRQMEGHGEVENGWKMADMPCFQRCFMAFTNHNGDLRERHHES